MTTLSSPSFEGLLCSQYSLMTIGKATMCVCVPLPTLIMTTMLLMLLFFPSLPDLRGSKATQEMIKRDGTVSKQSPVRKLEFSLEDQIYQIYRKARILSGRLEYLSRFSWHLS